VVGPTRIYNPSFHGLEGYLGYDAYSLYLLLLLDRVGQVGGSVEYSKGKGGESVVAILRFLCSNPHLCRLRTNHFGSDGKL
jgi:hypothetical protein